MNTNSSLSAKAIFGIMGLAFGVGAVGIFKLKTWALDTVLFLQLVLLANGLLSLMNPRFLAAMQEATQHADAANPSFPGGNPFLTDSVFRAMMIFGLCFSVAIITLLLFYRPRFREAASLARA